MSKEGYGCVTERQNNYTTCQKKAKDVSLKGKITIQHVERRLRMCHWKAKQLYNMSKEGYGCVTERQNNYTTCRKKAKDVSLKGKITIQHVERRLRMCHWKVK
jgi:predicted nucleic acid-binding Zn finger protein